eukprot:scpid27371/ scgid18666/ 
MQLLLNCALVATCSVVCLLCRSSGVAADCRPAPGPNLLELRSALGAYGVTTADGCFQLVSSVLSPPSVGNSTNNVSGASSPVRDTIGSLFINSVSLASLAAAQAQNNISGSNCSQVQDNGARLVQQLQQCQCTANSSQTCPVECLQQHHLAILALSEQVVRLCQTSASDATMRQLAQDLRRRLPGALSLFAQMPGLVKSLEGVNRVTNNITSLSQFRDSTVSDVTTSSLSSGESLVLVCAAMFPFCSNSTTAPYGGGVVTEHTVPVCSGVCNRLRPAAGVFGLFADVSAIPIVALLTEALAVCPANSSTPASATCVSLSVSSTGVGIAVIDSTMASTAPARFCLNLTCPSPLRATTNSAHWSKDLQSVVFGIHSLVQAAFPGSSTPFNGSILPCGTDCIAIGISDESVRISHIFLSVFSTIAVVVVSLSVVVFCFNRKRLGQRLVRRVLLTFTITGGIASLTYVSSAYNDRQSLLCHDDGTILLNEPAEGNPLCTLGAISTYFFVTVTSGYFVAMAHSWFQLIGALNKPNLRRNKTSMDVFYLTYRYDFIYAACAMAMPLVLSIVLLAVGGIEGNVINGVCSLSVTKNYYVTFFVAYFSLMLLLATLFMLAGVRVLKAQRQGMSGVVAWIKQRGRTSTLSGKKSTRKERKAESMARKARKQEARWSGMERHERKTRKEINRLAFQMLYYCLVAIINVICTVILGVYIGVQSGKWKDQTEAHVLCLVTSCEPESCTPLPSPQVAVIVFPLIVQFASLALIASWTFSPEFLVNVPLVKHLFLGRKRSDTTTTSSGYDSVETPSNSQLAMNVVDTSPAMSRHATLTLPTTTNSNGAPISMQALSPLSAHAMPGKLDTSGLVPSGSYTTLDDEANGSTVEAAGATTTTTSEDSAIARSPSRSPGNVKFLQSDV